MLAMAGRALAHGYATKRADWGAQVGPIRPIGRIGRISRIRPIVSPPLFPPGGSQAFAAAALMNELLFQAGDLLVQQVIGLMDQAYQSVRDHGVVFVGEPQRVGGRIRSIRPASAGSNRAKARTSRASGLSFIDCDAWR